jgi:YD repeat-containing protein
MNLKKVIQGAQQRTFTYDSLSRLRTATNPESGTITYQYDDTGNLIVKTDARLVSAHYEYDSINRITRRWYNGSSSMSNTTHNVPALPSGVGATDEVKFYYDSQSLPGGAPSYSRGAAIGRLVAQTYGAVSNGDYYAYDVLGRPNLKLQQTGAVNYLMSAGYTLSGALSSLTYPSGNTISNTFDQAGRLTTFSGNLGGTPRSYSTGSVYSSLGSLLKEQFGTDTSVYHKLHYNSRAQLCDVRASNVNNEWREEASSTCARGKSSACRVALQVRMPRAVPATQMSPAVRSISPTHARCEQRVVGDCWHLHVGLIVPAPQASLVVTHGSLRLLYGLGSLLVNVVQQTTHPPHHPGYAHSSLGQ